jgi:hypothetical protein
VYFIRDMYNYRCPLFSESMIEHKNHYYEDINKNSRNTDNPVILYNLFFSDLINFDEPSYH